MSVLEAVQFRVGLTKDAKILKQLKRNKMFRRDEKGEYLSIQFDAQEFKFRPGVTFTVGKSVGNALIRSSAVLVGDDPLGDPFLPYVEKVNEFRLGDADGSVPNKPDFACDICGEDCETGPRLARHMMKKHKDAIEDEDEKPSTAPADPRRKQKIDWDTPVNEQVTAAEADGADEAQE